VGGALRVVRAAIRAAAFDERPFVFEHQIVFG
jgi:hypothetical protein